jgi:hypothetical protein
MVVVKIVVAWLVVGAILAVVLGKFIKAGDK